MSQFAILFSACCVFGASNSKDWPMAAVWLAAAVGFGFVAVIG